MPASIWRRRALPLVIAILICEGVGALAGIATQSSVNTWYPTLAKPSFTPPDWLFAPVWITLYAMMGVAAALIWQRRKRTSDGRPALIVFGLQLVLNAAWSVVFFGARSISGGLLVIIVLLAAILETMRRFDRIHRPAMLWLVPYLLWVSYATALNASLWGLN